jgi:hypothetical protein
MPLMSPPPGEQDTVAGPLPEIAAERDEATAGQAREAPAPAERRARPATRRVRRLTLMVAVLTFVSRDPDRRRKDAFWHDLVVARHV